MSAQAVVVTGRTFLFGDVDVRAYVTNDGWTVSSTSFSVRGVSEDRLDAVASKVADFERRDIEAHRAIDRIHDEFIAWRDGGAS